MNTYCIKIICEREDFKDLVYAAVRPGKSRICQQAGNSGKS